MLQLQQLQQQVDQLLLTTKAEVAEPLLSSHSLAAMAPSEPSYHHSMPQPYRSPYAPPPPPSHTDTDRMMQSLRQQNQWMEQQQQQQQQHSKPAGVSQYTKAAGGGPAPRPDHYATDSDEEVISTALICPNGPQCRKPEGCDLYHWPMRLCDFDGKVRVGRAWNSPPGTSRCHLSFSPSHLLTFTPSHLHTFTPTIVASSVQMGGAKMCTKNPTGMCAFLHTAQLPYIVRDEQNKMIGIKKAGFLTCPFDGKRPVPYSKGAPPPPPVGAGAGASSAPSAASSGGPPPSSADMLSASDLCPLGMGCRGGCNKLHWPNRVCDMDATCSRYPKTTCTFLHARQKKYMVLGPDGSLRGIKKLGFKTLPNGGKK